VVVVRVPEHVLVDELAAAGVERLDEAALLQERQRAVHRRARHVRAGLVLSQP
jgi:hypothetical protein